jgi:hypothetical protein
MLSAADTATRLTNRTERITTAAGSFRPQTFPTRIRSCRPLLILHFIVRKKVLSCKYGTHAAHIMKAGHFC